MWQSSVKDILENEGIDIILDSSIKSCKPAAGGGGVTLAIDQAGESREITGSHVLFAIGRVSNCGYDRFRGRRN